MFEFLTFCASRRQPEAFVDSLKRCLHANRRFPYEDEVRSPEDLAYWYTMSVWRVQPDKSYKFVGDIDLSTVPKYPLLDAFIEEFLDD